MYIKTNLKTPIVALVVCGGLGQKYRLVLSHFIGELAIVIGVFGAKLRFYIPLNSLATSQIITCNKGT